MIIGGGFAGLAGALQTTAVDHTFYARFSGGYGFGGIAVAFLGLCEPWAIVPAALIIATVQSADRSLQLDVGVASEFVFVIEGMMIMVIAVLTRWNKHD